MIFHSISELAHENLIFHIVSGRIDNDNDDFFSGKEQSYNQKLCEVRKNFDKYNLISGLHTFYSKENKIYENILPPLRLLNANEEKDLIDNLNNLDFKLNSKMAA